MKSPPPPPPKKNKKKTSVIQENIVQNIYDKRISLGHGVNILKYMKDSNEKPTYTTMQYLVFPTILSMVYCISSFDIQTRMCMGYFLR